VNKNFLWLISDGQFLISVFLITLTVHAESLIFFLRMVLHGVILIIQAFVKYVEDEIVV